MLDRIALILLIIGGLNWGFVGFFEFDLIARLFGGSDSALSRIVYILAALSAIWAISMLFRRDSITDSHSHRRAVETH